MLINSFSLAGPADSVVHFTTVDYILDGSAATVGGIAGFAVVGYLTLTATAMTDIAGENFPKEAALGLGYAVGMPLGAALGLNIAARIRGRDGAFKMVFKNAEVGVLMGIAAVMVAGLVSAETQSWAGMVALPLPVIAGVTGYHRSVKLQQSILQNGDAVLHDFKVSCRLWEHGLR